jgi:hypothetical protein
MKGMNKIMELTKPIILKDETLDMTLEEVVTQFQALVNKLLRFSSSKISEYRFFNNLYFWRRSIKKRDNGIWRC